MSCENSFHHHIALEVGNDLPEAEMKVLEKHLQSCQACRSFRDELLQDRTALQRLALHNSDTARLSRLRARVIDRIGAQHRSGRHLLSSPRRFAVAASLLLVLAAATIAGFWSIRPESRDPNVATRQPTVTPIVAVSETETPHEIDPQVHAPGFSQPAAAIVAEKQPDTVEDPIRLALETIPALPPKAHIDVVTQQPLPATEPLIVRLVSESGDVVIYWQIDA